MKSRVWVVVAACVVLVLSAACIATPAGEGSAVEGGDEQITLLVWDQFGEGATSDVVDQIYARFQELHPNVAIEREVVPIDQLATTARTALASGTGPDVVYHDVTPTRELIDAGLILKLNDFAEQYGWYDRFYDTGLSWTRIDNDLWGLGLESEFVGVFYNQSLFDQEGLEVPQTLSELLAFCEEASSRGFVPLAHSQNPGWQNYFSFTMPVHNSVGLDTMRNLLFEGQGRWDSEEIAVAMTAVYQDMKEAGCFVEDLNALDFGGAIDLFTSGEAFMLPTGTWVVDRILEYSKANDIRMMPWFDMEKGHPRVYTMGMGSAYFISQNSEHPEEATMFLDYLFSDEAVTMWIEGASRIPPVPADTESLALEPLQKFVIDTLEEAGSGEGDIQLGWDVDLITPLAFNEMLSDGWQAVFAGTKTVEEQLADLQALWEARE
jgi:raffinose/stachyose/melibiose transport system substrate-binding protein